MQIILLLGALVLVGGCGGLGMADRDEAPSIDYEVAQWPQLPQDFVFGQVVGVAVDSQDRVFVFHRAGADFKNESLIDRPTVAVFDGASGALVDEWGRDQFIVPHGLAIDSQGHVWLTDVGSDLVFEFLPDGTLVRMFSGSER